MAATVEDFILRMKVEGQGNVRQLSGTVQSLKDDIADLSQVGGPLQSTINGIINKLGPLGVAASIAGTAIIGLGSRVLQISGEMEDIAGSTGIASGVVNSFGISLIFAGGKAEDAAGILQRLNQSVQEAAAGNENLQKSFQDLGIFVTDTNGQIRPTQDILQDITAKFQRGDLSAKEYTATIEILGKQVRALELQKLRAVDDPAYTEATKNIDKLNDAMDILSTTIKTNLVLAFGEFAKAVNEGGISGGLAKITESIGNLVAEILNLPTDAIAGVLNFFGADIKNPIGLGSGLKAVVEQAKKDRLEFQAENVKLAQEKEKQAKILAGQNAPKGATSGGFGATPDATVKAREQQLKRIELLEVDQARQTQIYANSERLNALLQFASQEEAIRERGLTSIREIEINAQAEISKAKIEIYAQERLSVSEKAREFAAKEKEIQLKATADVEKARGQMTESLKREQERIQGIITQSKARVEEEQRLNDLIEQRNKFINENFAATDAERKRAEDLFNLEQERLKVLRQIALIKDLPEPERLAREKEINAIFDQRREKTLQQQDADKRLQENFNAGFQKAYRQYAEDARNAFERAGKLFTTITQGMEDAVVDFAKTGKFEFKGFINSILEDLLRSQVRQLIAQTLGLGGSRGGSSGIGRLLGFANGGIIPTNGPVIVGERGPELLIGAGGNRVVPNGQFGGGSVTYNINAVDAMSFKQLVASDPSFIHAVAMAGGKNVPTTRR
jgi:lambda family phage tail tape measure protein